MPLNATATIEPVAAGGGWGWREWWQQWAVVSGRKKGREILMLAQAETIRCRHHVFVSATWTNLAKI
jgi:hypothetical protein